jgi:predicted transcriptional regulator
MEEHKGQVLVNSEKQFVYRDSVNRGHVQLPRMMIHCINLTDTAKIVYGIISGFIYESGRSAFPSVSRIAMSSNCTNKTAIKYINELVEKGFIVKERSGNRRTNNYYMIDADKVKHLHVSEMFHRAVNEVYNEIEVCLYDNVRDALLTILEKIEEDGMEFRDIPVDAETQEHLKQALLKEIKKVGDIMFKTPNRGKKIPDSAAPTPVAETPLGDPAKKAGESVKGITKKSLPDELEKWKQGNFVQHFYKKYLDSTGKHHDDARSKHGGMVGVVLRKCDGDKVLLKKLIDTFFEIGYDNPTLENFCTSGRKAEIELYIEKGKKPYYLTAQEKKAKVEQAEQVNQGMSAEAFLNRIRQGGSK